MILEKVCRPAIVIRINASRCQVILLCPWSLLNSATHFLFLSSLTCSEKYTVNACVAGHQRLASSCDIATWYYGLGMAFLAIVAPSLPCFLGITALFGR